jgi:ParB-like chromosome segregation protein Spo0J
VNEAAAGDHQDLHSDQDTTFVEDDVLNDAGAEALDDFTSEPDELPRARRREGLPAGFRMRHDEHYVDDLTRTLPSIRPIAIADIGRDLVNTDTPASVVALTESIRRAGVLQPLLVMPVRGRFEVIDGARRLEAAALAGLRHVPCIVHDVDEAGAHQMRDNANSREEVAETLSDPEQPLSPAVAADLVQSLELADAQAAICARTSAGFEGRAAADVLQAELSRAARVARAAAIMIDTPRLRRGEATARKIVELAASATAVTRRLAGVVLDTSIADPDFRVPADTRLVTQALAGSIDVLLALGDEIRRGALDGTASPDDRIRLTVHCVKTRPAMIIEVSQQTASVEPELISRFFDPTSTLHPGGPSAALLLAAAARIIRAHGGRADVRREGPLGCTITFVLPQTSGRAAEV